MRGRANDDEGSPDLFGLTEEEKRLHRAAAQPQFKKGRSTAPPVVVKPKKGLPMLVIPIVCILLIFCLPVNAAKWLTAAGNMLYQAKSYPAAIRACDLALSFNPASARSYCVRAAAETSCEQYEQAAMDYGRALVIDPNLSSAYFDRGIARYKRQDYDGAITDFSQVLKAEPKNAVAYVRRGIARARLGQYDAAIGDYDEATKIDPTNTEALYNRSWAQDLQYDETMEKDTAVDNVVPNRAQHTKLAAEVTDLSAKLATAKTDPQLYYARGLVCLKLRQWQQAIADFDQAISLNPKFASAYANRGFAYWELKQLGKAISDYSAAIASDSQNASAYYRRGLAFDRQHDYSKAMADYKAAGRLNPRSAAQYAVLATADQKRLQPANKSAAASAASSPLAASIVRSPPTKPEPADAAIGALSETPANSIDKTSVADHIVNSLKFIHEGRHYSAAKELALALKKSPSSPRIAFGMHQELAISHCQAHNYHSALKEFDEALKYGPATNAYFYRWRSMAYHGLNQDQPAIADANKAIEFSANDASLYRYREELYRAHGQSDYASKDAQRAQAIERKSHSNGSEVTAQNASSPVRRQSDNQSSSSDEARSHADRGKAYRHNGQYSQAIEEFQLALASNPSNSISRHCHRGMGFAYLSLKEYDQALLHINAAISLGEYDADIFKYRAVTYGALNQWQNALADINKAIEIDPNHGSFYNLRSAAYRKLGRTDLAAADVQKASELGYRQRGGGNN